MGCCVATTRSETAAIRDRRPSGMFTPRSIVSRWSSLSIGARSSGDRLSDASYFASRSCRSVSLNGLYGPLLEVVLVHHWSMSTAVGMM
jgi:hypothetical protein